jgi:transposase
MSKTYRDWSPNQSYMFPPSPQDWLPEDDLVYFLLDTIATIGLAPIFAHYERELRGQPPFHPRMMVALLLYCYATGTRSSRKIMRRCHTDVACRIIVGDDIPDFRTISDFRKTHLTQLESLFVEVLKLCALSGLVKVGTIALDGTKVKANASRHKAMSYERMKEEEERLKEEVARLLAEAEATDATEDAAHGPDRSGEGLPEELARRQSRLAKIQQAKAELEERARKEAAEEAARREAEGKAPPATAPADAVPKPKDQINFTDPESRIMKVANKGWDQCGNAQAVANAAQIILAADVTDQANDKRQAVPMMDQARENLGLLQRGEHGGTGAARHRPVRGDRAAEAQRGDPAGAAGPDPRWPLGPAADGAEAEDEEGACEVRPAEGDHRADLRSDQAGAWVPAVLAAGPGGDALGVAVDVRGAQPAEAVAAHSSGRGGMIEPVGPPRWAVGDS